jgi:hypothetical protein
VKPEPEAYSKRGKVHSFSMFTIPYVTPIVHIHSHTRYDPLRTERSDFWKV